MRKTRMRKTRTMKKSWPIRMKQNQAKALMMQNGTRLMEALVALSCKILNLVEVPMIFLQTKISALANYAQ